jgi:hypothetical protein
MRGLQASDSTPQARNRPRSAPRHARTGRHDHGLQSNLNRAHYSSRTNTTNQDAITIRWNK